MDGKHIYLSVPSLSLALARVAPLCDGLAAEVVHLVRVRVRVGVGVGARVRVGVGVSLAAEVVHQHAVVSPVRDEPFAVAAHRAEPHLSEG